jgi:hypothetical protein
VKKRVSSSDDSFRWRVRVKSPQNLSLLMLKPVNVISCLNTKAYISSDNHLTRIILQLMFESCVKRVSLNLRLEKLILSSSIISDENKQPQNVATGWMDVKITIFHSIYREICGQSFDFN